MQILINSGWEGFKKVLEMKRKEVIKKVKESGLRGRSGSNFPTGLKWELMGKGKKYLICNADEGEPGTIKDKFILNNNPSLVIEGIAIACYAIGINEAFIYLRGEYSKLKTKLEEEIEKSEKYLRKINLKIKIILGAGSYLCGEETAILESIEGKRPVPRRRPPYPTEVGLYGCPTCINNVETLANVPLIFTENWNKDLKLYSLSGDVNNPGVYEIKDGTKLKDILSFANPRVTPKVIYFGASGGCVPYDKFKNLEVTPENISKLGCNLGSRAIIVCGKDRNIVELSKIFTEFFLNESCGYCTPCREGNFRIWEIIKKIEVGEGRKADLDILNKLSRVIKYTSYCNLGASSVNHLICELKYFKEEFLRLCK